MFCFVSNFQHNAGGNRFLRFPGEFFPGNGPVKCNDMLR